MRLALILLIPSLACTARTLSGENAAPEEVPSASTGTEPDFDPGGTAPDGGGPPDNAEPAATSGPASSGSSTGEGSTTGFFPEASSSGESTGWWGCVNLQSDGLLNETVADRTHGRPDDVDLGACRPPDASNDPEALRDGVSAWIVPYTGTFSAFVESPDPVVVGVGSGCDADAFLCDDLCPGANARVTFDAEAGEEVYIIVEGVEGAVSYTLTVTDALESRPVCE